jgi:hypothetical protein
MTAARAIVEAKSRFLQDADGALKTLCSVATFVTTLFLSAQFLT